MRLLRKQLNTYFSMWKGNIFTCGDIQKDHLRYLWKKMKNIFLVIQTQLSKTQMWRFKFNIACFLNCGILFWIVIADFPRFNEVKLCRLKYSYMFILSIDNFGSIFINEDAWTHTQLDMETTSLINIFKYLHIQKYIYCICDYIVSLLGRYNHKGFIWLHSIWCPYKMNTLKV